MDFATGRVVDSASAYNKQISCGEDVISRIIYAKRKRGLDHLQKLAVETINDLLTELQQRNGIELYEIHEVTVAGNTTMTHLLLGLDPRYLREEPYIPTISAAPKLNAGELGLHANMLARVHVLPSVGSYVGGDITAGVISSGMYVADKLTLFIDIGTNGEMVLGNKDWLLSCACSAGPAFEGGGVRHGMRATAGAIEDVFVDDATFEPTFRTVDDAPAVGICGSGLIDLLGELFVTGLVDKSGHLDRSAPTDRVRVLDGVPEYVVCWAERGRRRPRHRPHRVGHHQPDPRQGRDLRRLRGALHAASASTSPTWSRSSSAAPSASTSTSRRRSASACCPDQPPERFHFLGNTSAQGAYAALLCVNIRHDVLDVAAKMTYLELSADNSFMDEYTSALFLPHTDLDVFPTVRDKLAQRGKGAARRTHLERRMNLMTSTIAVAGKGGTGKTTIAGLLIRRLAAAQAGPILAIDADPASNLNTVLDLPLEKTVGDVREETSEKARANLLEAGIAKRDLLDYEINTSVVEGVGVDLLAMGRPEGPGCYCAANNMLRAIIDTIADSYPWVVIDNEAGLEHLSRRTTRDVDVLFIVSDATVRGITTAGRVAALVDRARHEGRRALPDRQPRRRRALPRAAGGDRGARPGPARRAPRRPAGGGVRRRRPASRAPAGRQRHQRRAAAGRRDHARPDRDEGGRRCSSSVRTSTSSRRR